MAASSRKGFVPVSVAAREFGMSRSAFYFLERAGRLRYYARTGDRRSYVNREEVAALSEFKPKSLKRT